ncbi:low molecular weight phosphatase family protein [Herbiconiux sp. P16]|uniref:arsenate reductase/protein-tyrosine-phosphatase family protein n=1 Tax=Herbiconiux wuyangfengii TaxID=3342794 RepID=UPI0035BB9813
MFDNIFAKPEAPPGPPRILFVCTGNICRSPLAEKLLAARLRDRGSGFVTSSAGLMAVVGASMEPQPSAIAVRNGAEPSHSATQLTAAIAAASTLILTMTREQRSEVAREYPAALRRTFTLGEFTRILAELPDQVPGPSADRTLFDTVLSASQYRGMVALGDGDDIDDPYRRSNETHERVGSEIVARVDLLASQILSD